MTHSTDIDEDERAELAGMGFTPADIAVLERARARMVANGGEMTEGQRRGFLEADDEL